MHGFTRDPKSGMWYSSEKGGLWFDPASGQCYSVTRGVWLPKARTSAPANGDEPAAVESARELVLAYLALPFEERRRFMVLLNDAESELTWSDLRPFIAALREAGVSPDDADAYYAFIGGLPQPANARVRGHIRGGRRR